MPRRDGTGPGGMGPMTGRGSGYCVERIVPGSQDPQSQQVYGFGRNHGGGRGRRNMFFATGLPGWHGAGYRRNWTIMQNYNIPYNNEAAPTNEQKFEKLKDQVKYLEKELQEIKNCIQEIGIEKK